MLFILLKTQYLPFIICIMIHHAGVSFLFYNFFQSGVHKKVPIALHA
jgi:hypothetical protein